MTYNVELERTLSMTVTADAPDPVTAEYVAQNANYGIDDANEDSGWKVLNSYEVKHEA